LSAFPFVSVIIPAFNEEKALGQVIAEIPAGAVQQVIVVDNASTDDTVAVARAAGAQVVPEPVRGYGRAVLTGLAALDPRCTVVVILDGDHSDFPDDLPALTAPVIHDEADLVIGSRVHAALPGALQPHQRFGNWLTCTIIRFLYGKPFTDLGPFRAIRRSSLDDLRMRDLNFGWNVEMHVKALRRGLRVAEVPVRYRPRIGTSKISGTVKGSILAGAIILWSIYRYSRERAAPRP
jgi:glycosyltransferase involved in cell wall biosynthesis